MSTPTPPARFDYLPVESAAITRTVQGILYVWQPAPSLFVSRVEGRHEGQAVRALADAIQLRDGGRARCAFFHDFWEMDDYGPDARARLTEAGRAVSDITEGIHIALSSKVVAFGVRAAGLILGNVTTYTERPPFELALREAIRSRVRIVPR
jgi:hypothetical protein